MYGGAEHKENRGCTERKGDMLERIRGQGLAADGFSDQGVPGTQTINLRQPSRVAAASARICFEREPYPYFSIAELHE